MDVTTDAGLATVADDGFGEHVSVTRSRHSRGELLGRYIILSQLGEGAMGVVYLAYDPELDRKVALKLLSWGGDDDDGRSRLLREAKALAKLNHPNIVSIHDVGEQDGSIYLAMEFVEGQTLAEVLARHQDGSRPLQTAELLTLLIQAGHGLESAHKNGVIHRDFKPANVMVSDSGLVKVMDFGLARASDDRHATDESNQLAAANVALTQAGSLIGTPAYMSPEQHAGQATDARSDQFSFCVTLWQAVYGERPFAGTNTASLAAAVRSGQLREPPATASVPRWLRRICERGLRVSPDARFDSMQALVTAVSQEQRRARHRPLWITIAMLAVAGSAIVLGYAHQRAAQTAACTADAAIIRDIWHESARRHIQHQLLATGKSFAPATIERAFPQIDDWVERWQDTRERTCRAGKIERTILPDLLDRIDACLDEQQLEFAALVDELSSADENVLRNVTMAIAALPQSSRCEDVSYVTARHATTSSSTETAEVRQLLAQATSQGLAGKYDEGLATAQTAVKQAEQLGFEPLLARARMVLGEQLARAGRPDDAERSLVQAYLEAGRLEDADTAARAATELVSVVGDTLARHAEARVWRNAAQVALGGREYNQLQLAELLYLAGIVEARAGDYDQAARLQDESRAIHIEQLGPDHPGLARSLNALAVLAVLNGRHEPGRDLLVQVLSLFEASLGPNHPRNAQILDNLGQVSTSLRAFDDAERYFARAREIYDAALGPEHPNIATHLNSVANFHLHRGALPQAERTHQEALELRRKLYGPESTYVGVTLINLGAVILQMHRYQDAIAALEQGLAIQERHLGPEHPSISTAVTTLADAHDAAGHPDLALPLRERAVSIAKNVHGDQHPLYAQPLSRLADQLFADGQFAAARTRYETAVTILSATTESERWEPNARFGLAKALWRTGGDRERAHALALEARHAWQDPNDPYAAAYLEEVTKWLQEHPLR